LIPDFRLAKDKNLMAGLMDGWEVKECKKKLKFKAPGCNSSENTI
jgi:hypothetical protein